MGRNMELSAGDRERVLPIIRNIQNELTINTVINANSPGNVYVDDINNPKSFFIKTPECNMIGGSTENAVFNEEIKNEIKYFDTVLCDSEEWAAKIMEIHGNCAVKPFKRKYFENVHTAGIYSPVDEVDSKFLYYEDLHTIEYINKEIVLDWITIVNRDSVHNIPIAAVTIKNNEIVSCSALDCIDGKNVEIGIKTMYQFRRRGYAAFTVSSFVAKLREAGIRKIGWHCMAFNTGSMSTAKKCGFTEKVTYDLFSPYPPVENETDYSAKEWFSLGTFYESKSIHAVDHYWQAARCYAHSRNEERVFVCVNELIKKQAVWFLDFIGECFEFSFLSNNQEWDKLIKKAEKMRASHAST
jgi:RimJ/RimL family protein N-acetyltransferase